MKPGQVFVRAKIGTETPKGLVIKWVSADVLDLDLNSFKAFVVDRMIKFQMVVAIKENFIDEEEIEYWVDLKHWPKYSESEA